MSARPWFNKDGWILRRLPAECVTDCTAQGSVDASVEHWCERLGFKVPRERAISWLREMGAWSQLELASETDETLAHDFEAAEKIARSLGYTQTAYASTSALWGLFCLRDRPSQRAGCVIKTRELGFLFVQDTEDIAR